MTPARPPAPAIEVLPGPEELARRAADEVVAVLGAALDRRPRASWVLAGGSTPRRLYELLAARSGALDWLRVELFWGDERCVEPTSPASNFALARSTLLASLALDGGRVHRIHGELAPSEAARRYDRQIAAALSQGPFDLVLLGLGADGHVASLFPGATPPVDRLAAVVEAPVEPRRRVTLTPTALASARRLLVLVSGREKAAAVAAALDPGRRAELVSDGVHPAGGGALWLLDRAAAGNLSRGALERAREGS